MVKIKYILYGMFLSSMILSLLFVCLAYNNINKEIYIKDIDKYTEIIVRMRERVDKLKVKDSCKTSLNSTIDKINATHFNTGKIKLKDYYEAYYKDGSDYLEYYSLMMDECNIESDDSIYSYALSAYSYPLEIKNKYYLNHEIHFEDYLSGSNSRKQEQEVKSFNTKYMELKVLDSILEVLE